MVNKLYNQFNIWKRVSNRQAFCYRVFQRLSDSYYAIQSKDGFSLPIDNNIVSLLNNQMIELFIEEDIETRECFYSTLEEAIIAFDNDFE